MRNLQNYKLSLKLPNKITCRDLTVGSSGTLVLTNPNAQCCDTEEHNKYFLRHENIDSNNEANFLPLTYSTVLRYKKM